MLGLLLNNGTMGLQYFISDLSKHFKNLLKSWIRKYVKNNKAKINAKPNIWNEEFDLIKVVGSARS